MSSLITVCAWCNLIRTPKGWVETNIAILILGLNPCANIDKEMTHGICEDCAKKVFHGG